jgi:MoaA/NifB/PqqE/SkfB family radical SAM enzyme
MISPEKPFPNEYRYFELLKEHLKGDLNKIFGSSIVIPRQLEIHLPGDGKKSCNFNCGFCEGKILSKKLSPYENKAISLIKDINGRIPFIIFGGIYSEPLLNPFLFDLIRETKRTGAYFGLHTNGSLLKKQEEKNKLISNILNLSCSSKDYISISIDAGTPDSHKKIKGTKSECFSKIIEGVSLLSKMRIVRGSPALRLSYLMCEENSSENDIRSIVSLAKQIGVDSLRFSIPYDVFGRDLNMVKKYKEKVENPESLRYYEIIKPFLSKGQEEKPYIFYMSPYYQDVDKMQYEQCIYSFYQITIGTDGYVYRCSSTASETFKNNRLGLAPDNFNDLKILLKKNQDPGFIPLQCFNMGARCNRIGLMVNYAWKQNRR